MRCASVLFLFPRTSSILRIPASWSQGPGKWRRGWRRRSACISCPQREASRTIMEPRLFVFRLVPNAYSRERNTGLDPATGIPLHGRDVQNTRGPAACPASPAPPQPEEPPLPPGSAINNLRAGARPPPRPRGGLRGILCAGSTYTRLLHPLPDRVDGDPPYLGDSMTPGA